MSTRKTRLLRAYQTIHDTERGQGQGQWFLEELRAVGIPTTRSTMHRWLDGSKVVENGDLLEGTLKVLEGQAMLYRMDKLEADAAQLREEMS